MHTLLKGAPVRDAIDQDIISRVELLATTGNTPMSRLKRLWVKKT